MDAGGYRAPGAWLVRPERAGHTVWARAKPRAIVLTHGHFDHAGSALELAKAWDVPVYAHPLEAPYLSGRSDYPPQDPTPGGAMSFMSRFFPTHGFDLGLHLKQVPESGQVDEMPGWRVIPTPGHTVGHVSLWRESDGLVLAGDAVATTNLDSWSSQMTWSREICRPPTPMTADWSAARSSLLALASLRPQIVAAGHGLPLVGTDLSNALERFANRMEPPPHGRYSERPPVYTADGVVAALPPPVPDTLPRQLAIAGLAAFAAGAMFASARNRSDS